MGRVNVKVNIDLKTLQKLQENVKDRYKAKVGILAGKAQEKHAGTNETMVEIGMQHEFGVLSSRSFVYKGQKIRIAGIPQRSFLRMPLELKKEEIVKAVTDDINKFQEMLLNYGMKQMTVILGVEAERIIQEAFNTQGFGQWERNISKKYILAKGSDIPLIDTGQLRRSITSKVVKRG